MNWKVRFRNKTFWLALIPALLILVNAVLEAIGIELNFENIEETAVSVVEAVFTLLAILGIAVDPTTEGITDSELAMTYTEPKSDTVEEDIEEVTDSDLEE